MTNNNLPACEVTDSSTKNEAVLLRPEESSLVDTFVERSQDFIPGLQVSLAKRVLVPGSKRVLCMAAHTSVPISDDEIASVSELALRLSDGTSCLLSLKFFNDVTGGFNANHFIYDPERYERNQDPPNLVVFLVATACVALTALGFIAHRPNIGNSSTSVLRLTKHKALPFAPPVRHATETLGATPSAPKQNMQRIKFANTKSPTPAHAALLHASNHNSTNANKIFGASGNNSGLFVPPPPPMPCIAQYSMPMFMAGPAPLSGQNSSSFEVCRP